MPSLILQFHNQNRFKKAEKRYAHFRNTDTETKIAPANVICWKKAYSLDTGTSFQQVLQVLQLHSCIYQSQKLVSIEAGS